MTSTSFKPIMTRRSTPNRLFVLTLLLTLLSSTILLHLTGMLSLVQAQTQACDITGTMSSTRTLGPLAESCDIYHVIGSIVVSEGATLTIEPGTTLRFGKNQTLTVHGTLIARGTQHDPILFTAGTTDTWGYIHFSPTSVSAEFDYNDTYTGGSVIQHAVIEKAGGASVQNNGALRAENSVPWVDHVAIRNNSTTGLRVFNVFRGNFRYRITHNTITNNSSGGVAINSRGSNNQAVLRGNTVRDNTGTGILVSTGIGSSNLVTIIDGNTITGNTLSSSSNAGGGGIHGYCHLGVAAIDPLPDPLDGLGPRGRERDDPVLAEDDADGISPDLLVERLLAPPEFGVLDERERVVAELLGLRADVAADVLDDERVDVERLGDPVEFLGARVGDPHPRRARGGLGRPERLRAVVVVGREFPVGREHHRPYHEWSPPTARPPPTASSAMPTITPAMASDRPG